MESYLILKGLMIYLMIGLVFTRPQYNYQSSSSSQSLPLPSNLVSNSHSAQIMQIIPSQPLSHTYLPPMQQNNYAVQPLLQSAVQVPQYFPAPTQSISSSVVAGKQFFKDVSQIPLQNSYSQAFSGQSSSYQSLTGHSTALSGQSQGFSSGFNSQSQGLSNGIVGQTQGISGGQSQGFSGGFNGYAQGSPGVLNGNSQSLASQSSSFNQQAAFRPQQKSIVTKDIFVHTAPPDVEEEQDIGKQLESIPIRKNYRIIFIKAPTQNLRIAAQALKQAQAINEEKTVIYVLSKKADFADLQKQISQIQAPQTVNQKPEVYFIKYKTNEEAQRAQQEIQAQYDKLGGSTSISNEGIAPVVGALESSNISASGSGQQTSITAPTRKYIPVKV